MKEIGKIQVKSFGNIRNKKEVEIYKEVLKIQSQVEGHAAQVERYDGSEHDQVKEEGVVLLGRVKEFDTALLDSKSGVMNVEYKRVKGHRMRGGGGIVGSWPPEFEQWSAYKIDNDKETVWGSEVSGDQKEVRLNKESQTLTFFD